MNGDLKAPRLHLDQAFNRAKWRNRSRRVASASVGLGQMGSNKWHQGDADVESLNPQTLSGSGFRILQSSNRILSSYFSNFPEFNIKYRTNVAIIRIITPCSIRFDYIFSNGIHLSLTKMLLELLVQIPDICTGTLPWTPIHHFIYKDNVTF